MEHRICLAVARALDLSEASVKRLFASKTFTLPRLEQVYELLNLEVSDLIHQMKKNIELTHQLTLEQETELASDVKLLRYKNNKSYISR